MCLWKGLSRRDLSEATICIFVRLSKADVVVVAVFTSVFILCAPLRQIDVVVVAAVFTLNRSFSPTASAVQCPS